MYILTIDTSDRSIVGVAREELGTITELAREVSTDSRHHAETLTPMVASVLAHAGIEKPDAIVAGTGPAAYGVACRPHDRSRSCPSLGRPLIWCLLT